MISSIERRSNWHYVTLNDVCTKITDGAHSSPKSVEHGMPMASVKDLTSSGVNVSSCRQIAREDYERLVRQSCQPLECDVLIAKDGASALKTVCVVRKTLDVVVLSSIAILRPDRTKILPFFLRYYLDSETTRAYMKRKFTTGSAIPRVVLKDLKLARIKLPPLPRQRKIVAILSEVDTCIKKSGESISKTTQLKRGLVQQLLTSGIGHTIFKQTEVGKIPEMWDVYQVEELAKPVKGSIKIGPFGSQLKKTELANSGIKVYGQENVISNDFDIGDRYISLEKYNKLQSVEVFPKDILVTMMGTLGFAATLPNDSRKGIMDSHLLRIQVNEALVMPEFVAMLLRDSTAVKHQITGLMQGSIMGGLNSKIVKALLLPIPPLDEQRKIISILTVLNQTIRQEIQREQCYKILQQVLMIDLITGEDYPLYAPSEGGITFERRRVVTSKKDGPVQSTLLED